MARFWQWQITLLLAIIFMVSDSDAQLFAKGKRKLKKPRKIVIDDFSSYSLQKLPTGMGDQWRIFSITNFYHENYFVREEKGNKYLCAIVKPKLKREKKAVTLIKRLFKKSEDDEEKIFYMPKDYPFLSWRWRVNQLPTGSNEMMESEKSKKSDSAAGVYIYYQHPGHSPNIIKFIWSETLPVRAKGFISPASKDIYQAHLIVLKSGKKGLGKWHQEKVNIYDVFKQEFGAKKEPPRILGIGVLTDADSTNTQAAADYDDFVLMSN